MLTKPDLLANFQAIGDSVSQGSQDVASTSQPPLLLAVDPVQPQYFYASMHRFWFEAIGGGDVNQLRYDLSNMLVYDVILHIISQALESGKPREALNLAEQLGRIGGAKRFVKDYDVNAPNYFEFIMLYATDHEFVEKLRHRFLHSVYEREAVAVFQR
ncbi:hypothetical protein H4R35_003487 [Dimargaris xerosporica]|nr:hypothetical protein H4R35_003487 [Dimargaris xerosporica]